VTSLQAEGFTKRALARLLKRLIDTGFLSKEPGQAGVVTTYRLHLPHLPPAPSATEAAMRLDCEDRPPPRAIDAAIATYNAAEREAGPLPPEAARLLAVMFPQRDSVCQRSVASLVLDGFDEKIIHGLLRALVFAGFLSRKRGGRGVNHTYQLHLPPRGQP
jgi:hypothetical protein